MPESVVAARAAGGEIVLLAFSGWMWIRLTLIVRPESNEPRNSKANRPDSNSLWFNDPFLDLRTALKHVGLIRSGIY